MNQNWKRIVGQRIRRLTMNEAKQILENRSKRPEGAQIGDPVIRNLTGGYSSQAIDFWVMMKLGEKAGFRK